MPIRKAHDEDIDALSALVDIWDEEEFESQDTDLRLIEDYIKDGMVFLYTTEEDEDAILGVMVVSDNYDYMNLQTLYVHPDYRGEGIGSEMMDKFTDFLNSRSLSAFLEVDAQNPAIALYERYGFKEDSRYKMPEGHIAMTRSMEL